MLSSSPALGGSMLSESNVLVGNAVRESCIGGDAVRVFGATLPRGFILVLKEETRQRTN